MLATVVCAATQTIAYAASGADNTEHVVRIEHIVPITKAVPSSAETIHAPDIDPPHYKVLDGTHFSYRCFDPYVMRYKQAAVEVCDIDPVKLQINGWPETEFIQIISGEVRIWDASGTSRRYTAGDMFVLPEGFRGIWEQPVRLQKVVVRQPLYWKE